MVEMMTLLGNVFIVLDLDFICNICFKFEAVGNTHIDLRYIFEVIHPLVMYYRNGGFLYIRM